jgi:multiple sugar transport system permease protein
VLAQPIGRPSPVARLAYQAGLAAALLLWLLPLCAIGLTSLRSGEELARGNYWTWPRETALIENYRTVLTSSPAGQFLLNSLIVTIAAVIATLAISLAAAYALGKRRLPGSDLLLAIFLAGNFVPYQILMIPVRDLMIDVIPLYDTKGALIVFHTAFQTGFCTFFLANFIREVPDELLETARLEGASEAKILLFVVQPLVRPALAALGVLVFTFVWNDYFWALVLVQSDEVRPITAGLQTLRGMYLTSWNLISAAAILAALPPVALFYLMQRQIVEGLAFGARKV